MVLASRGLRDLDSGVEPVEDDAEKQDLRRIARGVWGRTVALAAAGTLVALLL